MFFLMNYWQEWISNWRGASLGPSDSSLANEVPGAAPEEDSLI